MLVSDLIARLNGFKQDAQVRYTETDMSWSADFEQIFQVDNGEEAVVMFCTREAMTFGELPTEDEVLDDVLVDEDWINEAEDLGTDLS